MHTFHQITKAYELLSNPEQRNAFDVKSSGECIHNSSSVSLVSDIRNSKQQVYKLPCESFNKQQQQQFLVQNCIILVLR